ncbi:hypothetical protein GQ42DRAFT_77721 [Ramicandelaber brevisporus]|nr:hypothetical protein GQ42DRAFT_77721 [Ramicandelaber brevisporus]
MPLSLPASFLLTKPSFNDEAGVVSAVAAVVAVVAVVVMRTSLRSGCMSESVDGLGILSIANTQRRRRKKERERRRATRRTEQKEGRREARKKIRLSAGL